MNKKTILVLAGLILLTWSIFAQTPTGIFKAAYDGDLEQVKQFVASGGVMQFDEIMSTPLHHAADGGQSEVAAYLIEYGADVNFANNDGFTPLHSCALHGDSVTARLLINAGATVYTRDNNQMTPLHLCGLNDNVGVAEILVSYGADINDMTTTQWTPLRVAQWKQSSGMIAWLTAHGATQ